MRTNVDRAWRFGCLCLLVVCTSSLGCGGSGDPTIAPVKGIVSLDGKPVEGVQIIFQVQDSPRSSMGITNDKGEYKLTTFNTDDGAIVGENSVSIVQMSKDSGGVSGISINDMQSGKVNVDGGAGFRKNAEKSLAAKTAIPKKYANPKESGFKRAVVLGSKNEFNFDLKP